MTPNDSTVLTEYGALAILSIITHGLCFSSKSADCISTLESVRESQVPEHGAATRAARCKLRDDVDQKLEHVSFTFDTIQLGSLIVCGLPALPHDLVHESDAKRRLLTCINTLPIRAWLLRSRKLPLACC